MTRHAHSLLLLVLGAAWAVGAARPLAAEDATVGGLQVTYLANEGFLLEADGSRVVIDGLFGDGLAEYPTVPPALRSDLEAARGRFADIDLILVSHAHADHFDAQAVARHLRANPQAAFLSTPEAAAEVRQAMADAATGREILEFYPPAASSVTRRLAGGGVEVVVLNLSHGPLPIQNLGLLVRLGGVGVLHVGDTSAQAAELHPYSRLLATADIWLLPDWLMGEPAWEEARALAGEGTLLVNMHLAAPSAPPDWFGSAGSHAGRIARVREALPDAWIPVAPLDSRRYSPVDP